MNAITAASWARLKSLLDHALDLDEQNRGSYLESLKGEDASLRAELIRLLADHQRLSKESATNAMDLAIPFIGNEIEEEWALDKVRVGQSVGAYRLTRLLGTGGMGAVYLAERSGEGFSQQVALKVVRRAFGNVSALERFERERQILAGLKHPGIALLFDGGRTQDGQPFYTMEYVDGEIVTHYCYARLDTVAARVQVLLQIATALAYAHQNLTVHRDIKPSNVLVNAQGQIKLVDFGLAKLLDQPVSPMTTQAGMMPMTQAYAAPEQFQNGAITVATDIYQFGVLCFVVLTGCLPYQTDPNDALAWARAVTEGEPLTLARAIAADDDVEPKPPTTAKYRRQLTSDLNAILRKSMAKNPRERYGSMDAMMADLRAFLAGHAVTARRAGPAYFAWRFAQRHRYAVASSILAFVALSVSALVAVQQSHTALAEANRANAVADFLVGLFRVSDPGVNRGERLNANQILEQGAERINSEMASQPEQRARLQSVIGEVYVTLGDYPRARAALDPAITTLRNLRSADPVDFAHALNFAAFISARQGDYQPALSMLSEAEAVLDGSTPRQLEELGSLHGNRAMVFNYLGDYARSREEFGIALRLRDQLGLQHTLKTASTHNSFGNLLRAQNDLQGAQVEYRNALATYQDLYGVDSAKVPAVIGATMNLAVVLIDLDQLDKARPLLEKASQFFADMNAPSNLGYANAENKLGEIDRLERKFDDASKHYDNSERAYRGALGDHNRVVALPIQNRGQAALESGRYDEALLQFERALALRLESLPRTHREVATSLDGRGQALLRLGRNAEARQDAEEALAIWRKALPSNHPLIVYSLLHVGLARFALGDVQGAQTMWNEALDLAPHVLADNPTRLNLMRRALADPLEALAHPVPAGSYDQ